MKSMKIFAAILLAANLILMGINIYLGVTGSPDQYIFAFVNVIGVVAIYPVLVSKRKW